MLQSRALGTLVSEEVRQKVLIEGTPWVDRAFVLNDWFISGYSPLKLIFVAIVSE